MEKLCHLSIDEISEMTVKAPLIEFLVDNYPALHEEGMGANLHAVQKFLACYGIQIEIDYALLGKRGMPS